MKYLNLTNIIKLLFFTALIFTALILGENFFKPIVIAMLLSMLFLPLCKRLEKWGLHRGLAAAVCSLIILIVIATLVTVVAWQVSGISQDMANVEQQIRTFINNARNFITEKLNFSREQQEELIKKQSQGSGNVVKSILGSFSTLITSTILVLIYNLLFLLFRSRFKRGIIMLFEEKHKDDAKLVLKKIQKVSFQYLAGMMVMIVCLWILYSIAFSIIGVKHAIFFAVLSGTLEIIPFVGNITGNTLTAVMALVQGGGISMALWVAGSYMSIQLLQNYLLQPIIIGKAVNINPFFIIATLILGGFIWGIAGMAICIPITAIIKIICDHVEALKPIGEILGNGEEETDDNFADRIKGFFKKKK